MDFPPHIALFENLLDVLLAGGIVLGGSRLVKEILALRILGALAALLAGHLAARLLSLDAVRLLLDTFLVCAPLALVVIFQTDVRRAFSALTRSRESQEEGVPHAMDELVNGVCALVEKRIGGLIVIERSIPVDGYLVVGTEIDAKVSSELISSIFLPYSPIHDGAVIIQHGKLTKAGCFLPLTQDPEVSKSLGTRHRAAMGLSELVDAVVVVVSEETGLVCIITEGRKTEPLDPAALKKMLKRLVEPRWLK